MTAVGSSIFLLSSQATDPNAFGEQLIAARDPETNKNIAQVYTMNSDGISIEVNGGGDDDDSGRDLESQLLDESRRSYLLDNLPSSLVPHSSAAAGIGGGGGPKTTVIPWWMPARVHSAVANEMSEQYKRAAHRSRCIFFATLPHFQDLESVRQLEGLMGADSFAVEILNKGAGRANQRRPAFTSDSLLRLHRDQNGIYDRAGDHPYVFVSFDPAAGGVSSNAALISAIYDDDTNLHRAATPSSLLVSRQKLIIVGVDAIEDREVTRNYKLMAERILAHIMYIKTNVPGLAMSKFLLIIEGNLPGVVTFIRDHIDRQFYENKRDIARLNLTIDYYSDPDYGSSGAARHNHHHQPITRPADPTGFYSNQEAKHIMAEKLKDRLQSGTILFHKHFFTTTLNYTLADMRLKLHDELSNYCVEEKIRGDRISYVYGGKAANGKMKDDLPMALMILNLAHDRWLGDVVRTLETRPPPIGRNR